MGFISAVYPQGSSQCREGSAALRAPARASATLSRHRPARLVAIATIRFRRQPTGPGDITMAGRIGTILPFAKNPLVAVKRFAQCEIVGGDVLFAPGKSFFRRRELIHERETDVLLPAGKVHRREASRKGFGRFTPVNFSS